MYVEWDEEKAEINKRKHGISFEAASFVFSDPYRLERYDRSQENNGQEDRYQTLGLVGNVLFVVFTLRNENTRIISAREATSKEKRIYYGSSKKGDSDWRQAD